MTYNVFSGTLNPTQSINVLQNTFETTSPFTDAWRLRDCSHASMHIKSPPCRLQRLLLLKQTVDSLFLIPAVQCTVAVDFIQSPVQIGLLNIFCWNSVSVAIAKSALLNFARWRQLFVTRLTNLELTNVLRTKQRWNVPKLCKRVKEFWRRNR